MKNIFTAIQLNKPKSSRFDLSHDVKMSFQMGELVPSLVMEVLPGDKITIRPENMLRFAPLISPVMHKVNVYTRYFFVPNRILWPDWDRWITGDLVIEHPYIGATDEFDWENGSLADYLGIPMNPPDELTKINPFPFAAYLKVWDDYFRDQNLQQEQFTELSPGDNSVNYVDWFQSSPLHAAWRHDYFTSCLPFAQKGESVQVPLTTAEDLPVEVNYNGKPVTLKNYLTGANTSSDQSVNNTSGPVPFANSVSVDDVPVVLDPQGTLVVDVQGDAVDINTLRRAFRLQEWLEKNARGGTRYIENMLVHFGIRSSDSRLQRPEHIGTIAQNMVISEVLATAQSTPDGVSVGTMAGHGISVGGGKSFTYRSEEHGWIIGVMTVQPRTAYQQGLHRSFSRFDTLDYAWPTFANLGEQEVLNKEVYLPHNTPNGIFGYIPRYAEYKFMNSRVAGEMRGTLNFWHLGRIFSTDPALNEDFIKCNPSTRIFAVTDPNEDHIYCHVINNVSAVRKLPRFGIPTI